MAKAIIPPEEMKTYWEGRASQDALFWTWSNRVPEDKYFESGRAWIENHVRKYFPVARGRCIEIGCGVGRVSLALSGCFDHVTGIDISEGMIEKALGFKSKYEVTNVDYKVATDLSSFKNKVDFIFSLTVFQHIFPKVWIKYVEDGYALLNQGGRFHVHALFDDVEKSKKEFTEMGYKIIAQEPEGDCWTIILEK